ncbi:Ig-like domain-containing protein [Alloalcanivorax xenomutans]|uniref:Ig-like domain-containing protein n=1 Tax=Alloalcanivorax xenomutans TaxID=1094342 RepID=UPI000BD3CB6A|nr:Ig-like domain-containing protein [Alloalcanivorax xenomutans]SOC08659.1 Ig-like domain-containing protein [Alloalcanivorax xenomutans]
MSMRIVLALCGATLLAACGGGGGSSQSVDFSPWEQITLYYSYPYNAQAGVSPNAPLVLAFSEAVPQLSADQFSLRGPDGAVQLTLEQVNGNKSVVLTPAAPLAVNSEYTLTLNGIGEDGDKELLPGGQLAFSTRPALEGAKEERSSAAAFQLERIIPNGDDLPFLDFSSVQLTLSQPIDPTTVKYGETVRLTQGGELVPATVLANGRFLTVDPTDSEDADGNTVDALKAGEEVTLEVTGGVQSLFGEQLTAINRSFTPLDTKPRSVMVQEAAQAGDPAAGCLADGTIRSPLNNESINCVPVKSNLLGDTTVSMLSGDVFAELAFAPNFPDTTPLRLPRGSLLHGEPLDVLIGGQVPAGFDSGDVTVTILSDANGYLMNAPYSTDPNAPRRLVLTMDVAFDTADSRANGAFNQDLMQVELVGTAIVEGDRLVVDAIGVVEPRVLGVENAYGVLSFHMESYSDQTIPRKPEPDMDGPVLSSWVPGDHTNKHRPGDPVILTFDHPLDPQSVEKDVSLQLLGANTPVAFDYVVDGSSIVIRPETPLQHNTDYQVLFDDRLTDVAGNPAQPQTLDFRLPEYVLDDGDPETPPVPEQSPVVLTAYPGFPCVTTDRNLAANDAGRCAGGKDDDDHLPVLPLAANRPIAVTFSQEMDEQSVRDHFIVESVDDAGSTLEVVEGKLTYMGRKIVFEPDQPWEEGVLYRYTLPSQEGSVDAASCAGVAICDVRGLPLQTQLLAQNADDAPAATDGGPNLEIFFRGAPNTTATLQPLRNLPTSDVNANFVWDSGEVPPSQDAEAKRNSARIVRDPESNKDGDGSAGSGAVTDAEVGCAVGESCPDDKFSYISGNLDVEVVGFRTADEVKAMDDGSTPQEALDNGGVLVYIMPTQLVVSSATVYSEPVLGDAPPAATGPQFMRIRYTCDATSTDNPCSEPDMGRVRGWIVKGENNPRFLTNLDLYLDAPKLSPTVSIPLLGTFTLTHNLHSYLLDGLQLAGDVTFLDDGRLQIEQISQNKLALGVELGGLPLNLPASIYVGIPAGDTFLNYLSEPIKQ